MHCSGTAKLQACIGIVIKRYDGKHELSQERVWLASGTVGRPGIHRRSSLNSGGAGVMSNEIERCDLVPCGARRKRKFVDVYVRGEIAANFLGAFEQENNSGCVRRILVDNVRTQQGGFVRGGRLGAGIVNARAECLWLSRWAAAAARESLFYAGGD